MVKKKVKAKKDWYSIIPILMFAGLCPLIVHLKITPLEQEIVDLYLNKNIDYDFFSFYKAIFIIISGLLAIGISIYKYNSKELTIKKTWLYVPIGVYTLLVILSALFSEHISVAVSGFPNRYEGMLVIVSYVIMMVFVINYINKEEHVTRVVKILFVSASIAGIIGIFQFFGLNIFESEFGKVLITPVQYLGKLQIKNRLALYAISSTLFNQNFVGSYMAMLLSLAATVFFMSDKKYKIGIGLFSCLMFANLIGSRSRAGLVGMLLAVIIIGIGARRYIIKYWKYSISLILAFTVIYVSMNAASGGILWGKVESLKENIGEFVETDDGGEGVQAGIADTIQDFSMENGRVKVVESNNTLYIVYDGEQLTFRDDEDKVIQLKQTANKEIYNLALQDQKYERYEFLMTLDKKLLTMKMKGSRYTTRFLITSEGLKLVDTKNRILQIEPVEHIDVKGKERVGNSRVYIWSRSIPVMKQTLLLGKGSDTFPFYFPQNDYVGKLIALGSCYKFVEKPHNMFIQMGMDSGVLSLIAFLVLLLGYAISSIKLYYNIKEQTIYSTVGLGAFAAVAGYLAAGMFNDSIVSVAPVFWTILGLGIAINIILTVKPVVVNELNQQANNSFKDKKHKVQK